MKTIYYNSSVAQLCKKNGIVKAVLLSYIYNYHKANIRKGAGYPASISLAEFVHQYTSKDKPLWKRSFTHKVLKSLEEDKHLIVAKDEANKRSYSVSAEVAAALTAKNGVWIGFELDTACEFGIYKAIVSRFLVLTIKNSPNRVAYHLCVEDMANVNCVSEAEIYRVVKGMVDAGALVKVKSPVKNRSRGLNLVLGNKEPSKVVNGCK
jgi:hypothetical protein